LCDRIDLDGPLFLTRDRAVGAQYSDGLLLCPDDAWGSAVTNAMLP